MHDHRWLIDNGADIDPIGGDLLATPLQWAARNGHLPAMHLLLSRSADPSIRDAQGYNTLHLVTHSSGVMALLYLLRQGVGVDERDKEGHTALMWAAWQGESPSCTRYLIVPSKRTRTFPIHQVTLSPLTSSSNTPPPSPQPTTPSSPPSTGPLSKVLVHA